MTSHQALKNRTIKQLRKGRAIRRQPLNYSQRRIDPTFGEDRRRERAFRLRLWWAKQHAFTFPWAFAGGKSEEDCR